MQAAIQIKQLEVAYRKGQRVLHGVGLSAEAQQCFALIGANGAGKTTLIKSVLDFVSVQAGQITLFGEDHRQPAARRHLAYLPERFHPAHYQTGFDFLHSMLGLHGVRLDRAKAEQLADQLALEPAALTRPARDYSKGMTQKLGLIYTLLSDCPLLLLDEPLSGLDPLARHRVLQQLQSARDAGRSLFISTHLLDEVAPICDRIGVLHHGEMRFVGTPQACCEQYRQDTLEQAYLACIDKLGD